MEKNAKNVLASSDESASSTAAITNAAKEKSTGGIVGATAPTKTDGAIKDIAPAKKGFYSRFDSASAERATLAEVAKFAPSSRGGGGARGVHSFNICCAQGNRHSLKLSKSLYAELYGEIDADSEAKSLQVLKDGKNLVISEKFPDIDDSESFPFSTASSCMVYHGGLVRWIASSFGLDFSNGRTSRSFQHIEVVAPETGSSEKPYAVIDLSRPVKK